MSPVLRIFASRQAYKVAILEDIRVTSWLPYCFLGLRTSEQTALREVSMRRRFDAKLETRQIYLRAS